MFKKECVDLEERRKIVYTAIKIVLKIKQCF